MVIINKIIKLIQIFKFLLIVLSLIKYIQIPILFIKQIRNYKKLLILFNKIELQFKLSTNTKKKKLIGRDKNKYKNKKEYSINKKIIIINKNKRK